jgi:hypothetical protein
LHISISVGCDNNIKFNISNRKFLGMMIDNTLTWKSHIEMIILKLSSACFAVRAITRFVIMDTLKVVYHSFFPSIINYKIIFWRNSSYSNNIFKLQKNTVRIIVGVGIRDSCTEIFKILNILPLISQYIYIYTLSHSSWLIMKINFGLILRYMVYIHGIILMSINHCHIWLFNKRVPFVWVLRYTTVFHLK